MGEFTIYKLINRKIFIILSILFFIFIIYLQIKVISNSKTYRPIKSDAIIILGHSIKNNNVPSKWLDLRLKTGLELYKNNYADKIIVSGGKGPKDKIPVSHFMKNWLVNNDIPEDIVLVEDKSNNTYENFKYSYKLSKTNNINSIIVVTNDFHIYRSIYIASMFFNNVSGKASNTNFNFHKILAYIKEPLSIIKYTFVNLLLF